MYTYICKRCVSRLLVRKPTLLSKLLLAPLLIISIHLWVFSFPSVQSVFERKQPAVHNKKELRVRVLHVSCECPSAQEWERRRTHKKPWTQKQTSCRTSSRCDRRVTSGCCVSWRAFKRLHRTKTCDGWSLPLRGERTLVLLKTN